MHSYAGMLFFIELFYHFGVREGNDISIDYFIGAVCMFG